MDNTKVYVVFVDFRQSTQSWWLKNLFKLENIHVITVTQIYIIVTHTIIM